MDNANHSQRDHGRLAYEAEIAHLLCVALIEASGGQVVERGDELQIKQEHRLDLLLTFEIGGKVVEIAVETLRHAYPRDLRQAVWNLEEYKSTARRPQHLITMVAAESLSPGAKELLRSRGIGYFERNGSLYLRWRQWLINIERPELPVSKKESVALFTGSREKVVHALLKHPRQWLTGGELAEIAQTSSYTCSVVLQELVRREWCESSGAGRTLRRRLIEPGQLLDAWAGQWQKRKEKRSRWYVFPRGRGGMLLQLTYEIDKAGIALPWAFTGTAAANIYAPLLTAVDTAEIIVPTGTAERLAKTLQFKPAEKGANVTLVERDPEGASMMFPDRHPEYPSYFASPFILYLDLLDGRGRNKELAQHVREKLEL